MLLSSFRVCTDSLHSRNFKRNSCAQCSLYGCTRFYVCLNKVGSDFVSVGCAER